jgi:hypothetical protein
LHNQFLFQVKTVPSVALNRGLSGVYFLPPSSLQKPTGKILKEYFLKHITVEDHKARKMLSK